MKSAEMGSSVDTKYSMKDELVSGYSSEREREK